ncbi:hypothetical protein [Anaerosporobacter sp.]|uniref:hypothetical protein n=1 Tax=Anaerosporobacter sp. TaxID=1872529 RepID=UPI00286F1803|nr:hypothetical protein [Anaerosporobacter sp.]
MEKKEEIMNAEGGKKSTKKQNADFVEVYESALLLALLKNDLITKEEYEWCLEELKK